MSGPPAVKPAGWDGTIGPDSSPVSPLLPGISSRPPAPMHRRTVLRLAPAALAAAHLPLLAGAAAAAEDVRWKFEEGDTHTYAFDQAVTATVTQFGQDSELQNDLGFVLKWTIKGVNDDGSAVVDRTVERVTIKSSGGGAETVDFDSAAEGEGDGVPARDPKTLPARVRVLGVLAGQTVTATIKPDGTVEDVELPDAVVRAIASAGPQNAFGEEQVKTLFTDQGFALPPAGAEPGTTYEAEETLPLDFGTVIDARTMTLKSTGGGTAVIAIQSEQRAEEGTGPAGAPVLFESGTQAGTATFSTAGGFLAKVDTTGSATLTGPGGYKAVLKSTSKLRRTGD